MQESHTKHEFSDRSRGRTGGAALIVATVIAAVILLGAVFAWGPWSGGSGDSPRQGGDDNLPSPQERIPDEQRPVVPPPPAPPQTAPGR